MSQTLLATVTCPYCSRSFEMKVYRSIWGEYPENKELVLSDKINVAHCPFCHRDTKLSFSLLYTNAPKDIAIWWEPSFDPQVEDDSRKYQKFLPGSYLAKAPRIRDWQEFKNMILKLERNIDCFKKVNREHEIEFIENNVSPDLDKSKSFVDIKFTVLAIVFLLPTLFDYTKCGNYNNFCFNYPYGFYEILKFIICGYFAYRAHKSNEINLSCIVSIGMAVLYNPFMKMAFEKSEWHVINIGTIFIILMLAKGEFKSIFKKYKKAKQHQAFIEAYMYIKLLQIFLDEQKRKK